MKYLIATFGNRSALAERSPAEIAEMITFMQAIDVELAQAGELVFQQGRGRVPRIQLPAARGQRGASRRCRRRPYF